MRKTVTSPVPPPAIRMFSFSFPAPLGEVKTLRELKMKWSMKAGWDGTSVMSREDSWEGSRGG